MKYIVLIIILCLSKQGLFAQDTSIKVLKLEQLYKEFSDSCFLSKIVIDEDRKLVFLGTNNGLFCFRNGKKIYQLNQINEVAFSISSFLIAENKLWCGTANGFVFSLDLATYPHFSVQQYAAISPAKKNKPLKSQAILSMMLDKTHLYAGTTEGIIVSYEIQNTTKQNNHTKMPNTNLSNGNIHGMMLNGDKKTKKQKMLVALADGLFYLESQTWRPLPIYNPHIISKNNLDYRPKRTPFNISTTYKISKSQNKIWGIGKGSFKGQTEKNILFSVKNPYDKTNMECFIYELSSIRKNNDLQLNDFQLDTKGNVWIVTENGLLIYDTSTQHEHYIRQETEPLFKLKQIDNIFLENDSTAYLFGVAEAEKGLGVFKMKLGKTATRNENLSDTSSEAIESLENNTNIECDKVLKLSRLIFASSYDSYVYASKAQEDVNLLANYLKQNPYQKVVIEGHTSIIENEKKESRIAAKRLERVKKDLLEQGVSKNQIVTIAKGDSELLIKKPKNAAEHQQNRRVIAKILCN